jgi:hypothetical protein
MFGLAGVLGMHEQFAPTQPQLLQSGPHGACVSKRQRQILAFVYGQILCITACESTSVADGQRNCVNTGTTWMQCSITLTREGCITTRG